MFTLPSSLSVSVCLFQSFSSLAAVSPTLALPRRRRRRSLLSLLLSAAALFAVICVRFAAAAAATAVGARQAPPPCARCAVQRHTVCCTETLCSPAKAVRLQARPVAKLSASAASPPTATSFALNAAQRQRFSRKLCIANATQCNNSHTRVHVLRCGCRWRRQSKLCRDCRRAHSKDAAPLACESCSRCQHAKSSLTGRCRVPFLGKAAPECALKSAMWKNLTLS